MLIAAGLLSGCGKDPAQMTDAELGLNPLQARGRGLFLVNQFADLVRLHTGPDGTTMRAYFGLPR